MTLLVLRWLFFLVLCALAAWRISRVSPSPQAARWIPEPEPEPTADTGPPVPETARVYRPPVPAALKPLSGIFTTPHSDRDALMWLVERPVTEAEIFDVLTRRNLSQLFDLTQYEPGVGDVWVAPAIAQIWWVHQKRSIILVPWLFDGERGPVTEVGGEHGYGNFVIKTIFRDASRVIARADIFDERPFGLALEGAMAQRHARYYVMLLHPRDLERVLWGELDVPDLFGGTWQRLA